VDGFRFWVLGLKFNRRITKNFISVDVEMVQLLTKALGEFSLVAANKIDKTGKEDNRCQPKRVHALDWKQWQFTD
jgi:hypothetical protein